MHALAGDKMPSVACHEPGLLLAVRARTLDVEITSISDERFWIVRALELTKDFATTRLGVIMAPKEGEPHEVWGVLNPAGIRAPDGTMHLFPRLIAEGNYSRIGHVRVRFDGETPVGVERLGIALEPLEAYERSPGGGGVEDPRVVYLPLLKRYVMT
jgi:hypothetical protein